MPLGRGDLFLLYTDGMTEAMDAGGDCFGDARLAAVVQEHADLPFDELRERILREIDAFSGPAVQQDDMTMLLLRVEDVGEPVAASVASPRDHAEAACSAPGIMSEPVVVFTTSSDIEASVVMALLDSHGIESFRASGNPQAIWPMAVNALGPIRIAVPEDGADDARRIIDSHREDVGSRVVRLRDEFEELQRASATASAIAACSSTR